MDYIVRSINELAVDNDFAVMVVFIPNGSDARSFAEQGTHSYASYVSRVRQSDWARNTQIIDILEYDFDYARFNVNRFAGHPSDYGTGVIADIIFENVELRVVRAEQ